MIDRQFRLARIWSNDVLREVGPLMEGEVVNVSAWMDDDKEGGKYCDYFSNATKYYTTNYGGYRGKGEEQSILLDLEAKLRPELESRFDVVFNHTTLEHVFDVFTAVKNLCLMSRDVVIVVVPAVQREHGSEGFADYWRFTSEGLTTLFRRNGMKVNLLISTPYKNSAIYHFIFASKGINDWDSILPLFSYGINIGSTLVSDSYFLKIAQKFLRK